MIATIQVLVVATLLASFFYWAIPETAPEVRRAVLVGVSGVLIFIFNPHALFLVTILVCFAYLVFLLSLRRPDLGFIPWLVALPLVIENIVPLSELLPLPQTAGRSPLVAHLQTLGLSFYTLKLFGSIKQGLKERSLSFRDMLTVSLFYPAFPMGPIDYAPAFSQKILSRSFDWQRYGRGLLRIGLGIAKVFIVTSWITEDASGAIFGKPLGSLGLEFWGKATFIFAMAFAYLSFLNLFLNFSGFTDIAIGSAWLFNIDLTENFNNPLRAHSIQNFWQRWHLSLSQFITKYLFKPMLRATGRPIASMVATFTLVGLWHKVSLGYLIWGIGHGLGLGLYGKYAADTRKASAPSLAVPLTWAKIFITITAVSVLSAIANHASNAILFAYLRALVRVF